MAELGDEMLAGGGETRQQVGLAGERPEQDRNGDVVVGATDDHTGQAICAFVILKQHHADMSTEDMVNELRAEVAREISPIAKPREIHVVPELPKTRSGKIMRRLLRDVAEGRELGDTSTLVDPGVFEAIRSSKAN